MFNLLITTTPPPPNPATRTYKHKVVLLLNKDVQYMYSVPCDVIIIKLCAVYPFNNYTMIMNEYL